MNTVDTQKAATRNWALRRRRRGAAAKKAKLAKKKADRAKKPTSEAKGDRANKKADAIALMKRATGATLAEIIAPTDCQAHTVLAFVIILGNKSGQKIESSPLMNSSPSSV